MARRRKLRGRKLKQQKMMILVGVFSVMLFLTVGYAAFQTNINLNVKGNIKRAPVAINGDVSNLTNDVVTTGSGLYDNGDGSYVYKGNDPYNYVTFNNELWRIVSISSNGQLKIIKDEKLTEDRVFDSNGNTGRRTSGYCMDSASVASGCNVWAGTSEMNDTPSAYTNGTITGAVSAASDLNTYLNSTYYNALTDKAKIIDSTFNIGPSSNESAYTWTGKVGLLTESEYTLAGGTNSYLNKGYEYYLINPTASSSTNVKVVNGTVTDASANTSKGIRPVVTLTCDVNLNGKGIASNPFVISAGSGTCSDTPAPASPYVYAYHTDTKTIGTSTVTDGVSDYTELSSWQNGKTWFLKYELDGNNVIQNAWACQKFSFINEPVCLQGGNASYYTANRGIIEGLATTFTSNGGSCSADGRLGQCSVGALNVGADSYGDADAYDGQASENCHVYDYGIVICS
ncbi:MAG: hypothetical protein IKJ43_03205 [Bacilli bacterium]|nr:hypothetical protein [Bacilli bacterium]